MRLGSKLTTFAWFNLHEYQDGDRNIYIHSIQADEWIPGNILATIGSALYTISSSGDSELLTGSIQGQGYQNGHDYDALFNKTAGILQLNGGREVIISDYWNSCLRKLDRLTQEVSTFAGECDVDYGTDEKGVPYCGSRRDGLTGAAIFCNVVRLRYREAENTILVLDMAQHETVIRAINLNTSQVSTIFSNLTFHARDFLDDVEEDTFTFTVAPGILQVDRITREGKWLAGCGNSSFSGVCASDDRRDISMILPHGLIKKHGIYIVSDFFGNEVYIVNSENGNYAKVCHDTDGQRLFAIDHPAAVEIVGDHLYIGQHVYTVDSYVHDYIATRFIKIYKVKLEVTTSDGE